MAASSGPGLAAISARISSKGRVVGVWVMTGLWRLAEAGLLEFQFLAARRAFGNAAP
jgi:hypothetical protein